MFLYFSQYLDREFLEQLTLIVVMQVYVIPISQSLSERCHVLAHAYAYAVQSELSKLGWMFGLLLFLEWPENNIIVRKQ